MMKMKQMYPVLAALGLTAGLMLGGCSEDTTGKAKDAMDAGKDAATTAVEKTGDMGGAVMDKAKDTAEDVKDAAAAKMDDVKDAAAAKMDDVKDAAADKVADVKDAAAGMMSQAQDMIAQIKSAIEGKDFAGAQALLDKLKAMPGVDKLAGIKDQFGSLQDMIDKGKKAKDALGGLMGQ